MKWRWGEEEQKAFQELKQKIANFEILGVPKGSGEIVLITDSSNIGGGSSIFQWQTLDPGQIQEKYKTFGVNVDGSFKHDYPENFRLVPLGNWNWKWNDTRKKYHSWEQELLACVLTLASQQRIVGSLPIVWFTDNEAITSFFGQNTILECEIAKSISFPESVFLESFPPSGTQE